MVAVDKIVAFQCSHLGRGFEIVNLWKAVVFLKCSNTKSSISDFFFLHRIVDS